MIIGARVCLSFPSQTPKKRFQAPREKKLVLPSLTEEGRIHVWIDYTEIPDPGIETGELDDSGSKIREKDDIRPKNATPLSRQNSGNESLNEGSYKMGSQQSVRFHVPPPPPRVEAPDMSISRRRNREAESESEDTTSTPQSTKSGFRSWPWPYKVIGFVVAFSLFVRAGHPWFVRSTIKDSEASEPSDGDVHVNVSVSSRDRPIGEVAATARAAEHDTPDRYSLVTQPKAGEASQQSASDADMSANEHLGSTSLVHDRDSGLRDRVDRLLGWRG